MVEIWLMSDFKKICITFSILKLQKFDACQNGVEFCHKPISDDVRSPLPQFYFLPTPLDKAHGPIKQETITLGSPVNEEII